MTIETKLVAPLMMLQKSMLWMHLMTLRLMHSNLLLMRPQNLPHLKLQSLPPKQLLMPPLELPRLPLWSLLWLLFVVILDMALRIWI
jgi:hypothetical protein